MKKSWICACLVGVVGISMLCSSCIGSFTLSNKLLSWNRSVGDKAVNELVFFAFWVLPVYETSLLADLVVLNSIEFWSGRNPVACNTRIIDGNDGKYRLVTDAKGYTITSLTDGSETRLDYHEADRSWSCTANGSTHTLLRYIDDTHVALPTRDGGMVTVPISDAGIEAYQNQLAVR